MVDVLISTDVTGSIFYLKSITSSKVLEMFLETLNYLHYTKRLI